MISYLILLFIVFAIGYLARQFGSAGVQKLSLFVIGFILVLFAGFRNRSVGTDTGNYVGWLDRINSVDDVLTSSSEIGFAFIVFISSVLSDNYFLLLTIIAIIFVTCYIITINRLVCRYETAIFIFITLGSYTFFFNGARQGLATAICFLALPFLLQRQLFPYALLVLLATLFHKTAIVALPLYYLASVRVGWKQVLAVLVSSIAMAISISAFAQLAAIVIDEKFATYGQAGEGGGEVKVLFLVVQAILFLLFRRQVGEASPYYARLLNIYLIGLIPAIASVIASVNPSGILRLTSYFTHAAILLWPMIFASFQARNNRVIATAGFLLLTLTFFVLTTSTFSNLIPYRINTELFG